MFKKSILVIGITIFAAFSAIASTSTVNIEQTFSLMFVDAHTSGEVATVKNVEFFEVDNFEIFALTNFEDEVLSFDSRIPKITFESKEAVETKSTNIVEFSNGISFAEVGWERAANA